jgi:shikimate dehydrogenase
MTFAKQANESMYYGRIFAELNEFKKKATEFFGRGGKGMNITVPFKLEAYELGQKKTPRAQLAQAANVLWIKDGELWCDNTDGIGLILDLKRLLKEQGQVLAGAKVLILGAGGAAQGVVAPLMDEGVTDLSLANRTFAKAEQMAQQFPSLQPLRMEELAGFSGVKFDLIINATATGLGDSSPITKEVLAKLLHSKSIAYDMVYGKDTRFMKDAQELGVRAVDGLGMLVEQAADAFMTWRKPSVALDINAAIAAARATY